MRTKHFNLQLLFVLLCFCSTVLSASDLTDRLKTIQAISQIQPIESKCFSEKYVIKFRHPVDYNDPEGMTFEQRVVIGHVGFDRPTVIVTEGYGGAYAHNPGYTEELYFRSYLLTVWSRLRLPMFASLLFSSILFASGHLYQGWFAVATIFIIGIVLGLWYFALKNIHLIAVAHALFNFLQLVFLYFLNFPTAN